MSYLSLKELGARAFESAKNRGFHDEPIDIPRALMLIVSELSEALEADRNNRRADLSAMNADPSKKSFEMYVKDTFEDELADAIIRLLDLSTTLGIDIETHIALKLKYNETRGYKHGKRY